jgi:hypothetical protein
MWRVWRNSPALLTAVTGSPAARSVRNQFGECGELLLERGSPSELNVLLISHLDQEGLHPRETLCDWLHHGGHERLNASTTRVVSRHSTHCTCAD